MPICCNNGAIASKLFGEKCWKHIFKKSVHLFVLLSLIFTISAQGKCLDFEFNRGAGWINCNEDPKVNWVRDGFERYDGSWSFRSGNITESLGDSRVCRQIKGPSNITFYWKLSKNGGQIMLMDDGFPKKILTEIRGNPNAWKKETYQINDNQIHKIEWMFRRTNNNLSVNQFGWIDEVCIDNGDFMGDVPPTIKIESIFDNIIYYVDELVDFDYIPNDDLALNNCTLLIDGNETNKNESPKSGTTNILSYLFDKPGDHEWCITCCDNVTQCTSISGNITIKDPRPTVSLNSPPNESQSYIGRNIEFKYKPSDNKELENCTLIIDGIEQGEKKDYQIENNVEKVFNYSFDKPGNHTWCVRCYDSLSQDNEMEIRSITVLPDAEPTVELKLPENNAVFFADDNISFEYKASDDKKLKNCTLIIDGIPVKVESSPRNGSIGYFSYIFAEDQMIHDVEAHNWTILCYDNLSKCNKAEDIRNISVRIDNPPVVLTKPIDIGYIKRAITFEYKVVDDVGIKGCALLIGENVYYDNCSEYGFGSFNLSFDQEGEYNWNVTCWDVKGHHNYSANSSISIKRPLEIYVNQQNPNDTEYQLIGDAVRDVAEGGTVYVRSGVYNEDIIIDKVINLVGIEESGRPIILGCNTPVRIQSSDVLIEGFEIRGASGDGGIYVETTNSEDYRNISLVDNHIVNNDSFGLNIWGRYGRKIEDVMVIDTDVDGCKHVGIYLRNCNNARLSDCRINCDEIFGVWCSREIYCDRCTNISQENISRCCN